MANELIEMVKHIEELEAKATKGPWKPCHHLRPGGDESCPCGYRGGVWGGDGSAVVLEIGAEPENEAALIQGLPRYERPAELVNAALICALRNDAPALLSAARRSVEIDDVVQRIGNEFYGERITDLESENARLREALRPFAERYGRLPMAANDLGEVHVSC